MYTKEQDRGDEKWPEINRLTDVCRSIELNVLPKVTAFIKDTIRDAQ